VLEVGCNRGHNLIALSRLLVPETKLVGLEPTAYAAGIARSRTLVHAVLRGEIAHLPFRDNSFGLVFTAGVLIHVPLSHLSSALAEIHRVGRRYLLAIEYFAKEETPIPYRGHDNLLWKRDFRAHFESQFAELELVRSGYWEHEKGFDRTTWWLFEKKPARLARL
jgi:SAM-dependent methyltransferase